MGYVGPPFGCGAALAAGRLVCAAAGDALTGRGLFGVALVGGGLAAGVASTGGGLAAARIALAGD